MTRSNHTLASFAFACLALLVAQAAGAADLEVRIEGLRSAEGNVSIALHRPTADAKFPDDAGVIAAISRLATAGSMRVIFTDLPVGDYAVAAFHDADADGELARNILGMPTEGYGFSNGARGFLGPPRFDAAAVTVGDGASQLSIAVPMGYPGGGYDGG